MKVTGIGEVLWDIITDSATGRQLSKEIGGAPANFAYHAAAQGMESWVVSAVGHDPLADETIKTLESKGVSCAFHVATQPTGTVDAVIGPDGSATYTIHENVAWDHIQLTPQMKRIAADTDVICFGTLAQRSATSRKAIHKFIAIAKESGHCSHIVFDPNLRPGFNDPSIVTESLPLCTILKVSDEEMPILCGFAGIHATDIETRARQLFDRYPEMDYILHTCGANGNDVFTRAGNVTHCDAANITRFENTVGAGDSFNATFVSMLLKGRGIAEAQQLATAVSGHVCSCKGAMPPIPHTHIG